jgi:glutamyl-Q tRNA(Asp) synthetase
MTGPRCPVAQTRASRHNAGVTYRGRFAPSPTGALHFGSLVAAVASWLDARAAGGTWLVRIEDLDAARNVPGAADAILRTLDAFGLHWDERVLVQSERLEWYRAALDRLLAAGHAFGCACTRSEIAAIAVPGIDGPVYPGTCRNGVPAGRAVRAWRVRVDDQPIGFDDRIQGPVSQQLQRDVGDFVVLRADNVFAYQLAVVVDDAAQAITDVVRGADLLDSTPRQLWLQRLLGLPQPRHAHLPLALNAQRQKLSKQTFAPAVDLPAEDAAVRWLRRALVFLGQPLPPIDAGRDELLAFARNHWSIARVPTGGSIVDG